MRCIAIIVLCCTSLALAAPGEFFVAPEGDDAGPGRADRPFATLGRAQQALRSAPLTEPRIVTVAEGTYRLAGPLAFDAKDSGSAEHPVLWRAAPGAQVRLTRGTPLTADMFGPVSDPQTLARLEPAAQGGVLEASLQGALHGQIPRLPERLRGPILTPELFFNDQRMALARWPNDGWAEIARVIDPGTEIAAGEKPDRGGVFEYPGDRPARWNAAAGVWLQGFWRFDWDEELIRVSQIDPQTHQIHLAAPALYSLKPGNPSPRRFRAVNLLEELDAPGEFFIDLESRLLYFWPPARLDQARIEVALDASPVLEFRDAAHITVRGWILENTLSDAVVIQGGSAVALEACHIRHSRFLGVRVAGGQSHRITACDIHDTGAGGVRMEGGDRRTLTPGDHQVVNTHIWRYSQHQLAYASAIHLAGVGHRAAHNLIHDAPHMAVALEGNDHLFEYNVIGNVCNATDDAGALYKGNNPSMRGNVIRYNFWRDIGSPRGHGTAAVYFDDGDGGDRVIGNVFYRCGQPGKAPFGSVFSHGGHDIAAENNLFIECRRALGSAPWHGGQWLKALRGTTWQTRLLQEVDITQPPYTTRYPELIDFFKPHPSRPRVNRAMRNVFYKCNQVRSGNWQCGLEDNWIASEDPGFVDVAKGDFRLRPDAPVFARLPGFEPVPFEKMGLYVDEFRPALPEGP